MTSLYKILEHPITAFIIGLIVLASGMTDLISAIEKADYGLHTHHGLILLGLWHSLQSLPSIISGMQRFKK